MFWVSITRLPDFPITGSGCPPAPSQDLKDLHDTSQEFGFCGLLADPRPSALIRGERSGSITRLPDFPITGSGCPSPSSQDPNDLHGTSQEFGFVRIPFYQR